MDISTFETFHTAIAAKLMRELLSGIPDTLTCIARPVMAGSAATGCRARAPAPV
jgi:protein required for attachment to host cells